MARSFALQLLDQPPAFRQHHRFMPGRNQCARNLQRAALDAAAVEGGEELKDLQGFHREGRICAACSLASGMARLYLRAGCRLSAAATPASATA
jgi:hypothetical protein